MAELDATGYQLPPGDDPALSSWADSLPAGASIRLDMWPPQQLWAAYFLAARPLCSQLPLLGTDYPHVPISRKADYIVATLDRSAARQTRSARPCGPTPATACTARTRPSPGRASAQRRSLCSPGGAQPA